MAREAPRAGIEVQPCDHFSRKELRIALRDVDYAVYLVHNRDPSARLDQAQSRDMDLLVADNFAWAAARNGVKQILCRTPLVAPPERTAARNARELEQVLASHGVPLTVLRTALVLGAGGELPGLLVRMVRRLPFILLPRFAEGEMRPLPLEALLTAFRHCIGRAETFGETYDIFGPEPLSFRNMLEETGRMLGRKPWIVRWPDMSEALYKDLMKGLRPSLHQDFLDYLMDVMATGAGQPNPVQSRVSEAWTPISRTLEDSLRGALEGAPRALRHKDDDAIRQAARVRSIQRLRLPEGKQAEWVAERYFLWLGLLMRAFIRTERDADGSWTVRQRPGGFTLLRLEFKPDHSTPTRRMYFITGGALARALGGRTARLEFRDLLDGRLSMAAIHDFDPALPWVFYRFTQAVIHGLVMKGFQGYMEQVAEGGPRL
jgi:uncharacterized protein YbjT (DUF2867 family)